MNKKGFTVYYVLFFIMLILLFSFYYYNQIANSTVNLVRDFEKMKAKQLCDLGLSVQVNIIYANYAKGEYDFYESLKYPIEFDMKGGTAIVEKVNILDKIKNKDKTISLDLKDRNHSERGEFIGKYDIIAVDITGKTLKGVEVKSTSYIKVKRLDIIK